jgi:GNAT superfamily N-acetyltransferase
MLIRTATAEDWPRIWPFFSAIVAAGETYSYPDGLGMAEARPWWLEQPPGRTVAAVAGGSPAGGVPGEASVTGVPDGTVLGSAKMAPNRPGRGSHIATASFMVDPAHQGRGVGRALGEHALDWARRAGYHAMQFNAVVETNTAAVALWRSLGFQILATVPEAFDHPRHGLVGLHVMYLRL